MFSLLILKNSKLKNIKEKSEKDKKETDHLYKDEDKKIIHYAELKSNLDLDTEKSKVTVNKCLSIKMNYKNNIQIMK